MTVHYEDEAVTVHHGDCLDIMATLPDASVDAVVTDPPYGLGFMGREWDDLPPGEEWARECLRVLKPGGYLLAFGGTRTWHRLACAVEDAGLEVRDSIAWMHGQGFPKGKAQLKPAFEPVIVARKRGPLWLNVDSCRVGQGGQTSWAAPRGMGYGGGTDNGPAERIQSSVGRWPTNAVLDGAAADELDRQSGHQRDGVAVQRNLPDEGGKAGTVAFKPGTRRGPDVTYGGEGGASRYFPTFRAPCSWAPIGEVTNCDAMRCDENGCAIDLTKAVSFRYEPKAPSNERPIVQDVAHPTVKPLELMRWLVRLVTPPGGTVLEPFAGSGTTAEACVIEGFRCIAIEREAAYLPLIVARLSKPIQPDLFGGAA